MGRSEIDATICAGLKPGVTLAMRARHGRRLSVVLRRAEPGPARGEGRDGITAMGEIRHLDEIPGVRVAATCRAVDEAQLAGGRAVAWASCELRDPGWDSFLVKCPEPHHEQTSLWGEFKGFYGGWRPSRVLVTRDHRIVGGVQILMKDLRRLGRIGYVTRGPVVAAHDPELIDFVLRQLHRAAAREKLVYLAVVLPYRGGIFEPGLRRLGFRPKPNALPPSSLIAATLVLDLSPNLPTLLAQMRSKTRQHIRSAERGGVTVREGSEADVEPFRRLMRALCERRGVKPDPAPTDYFQRLWQAFQPHGYARLFHAELEGKTIASVFAVPFADTVRTLKIGWAGDHAKLYPTELLYWEVIRWAKRNGFRFLDFVYIECSIARKLLQEEVVDWTRVDGISNFKLGFGGTPMVLPRPYYRFYHPLLRAFGQAGGSALIESSAGQRMLGRFLNRLAGRGDG